jgi:hypothetical protein
VHIQYQTCQRLIAWGDRSELEHYRRTDYLAVLSRVYARCEGFQQLVRRGPSRTRKGRHSRSFSNEVDTLSVGVSDEDSVDYSDEDDDE